MTKEIIIYYLKSGTGNAAIINKTDPILFGIFLFLFSSSLITFTLMCSTLFKKSKIIKEKISIYQTNLFYR